MSSYLYVFLCEKVRICALLFLGLYYSDHLCYLCYDTWRQMTNDDDQMNRGALMHPMFHLFYFFFLLPFM